jgi:hypothetical protein
LSYICCMSTMLIRLDKSSNKVIVELVKKLGGNVVEVNDEVIEDILLGSIMDSEKTGKTVSRATVMKKLKSR